MLFSLLLSFLSVMSHVFWMELFKKRRMANISLTEKQDTKIVVNSHYECKGINNSATFRALTYVSWGCVFVGELIELSGSHRVHLDESDASTTPLLRLVDREKGLKEQIDNALGDGLGINSQAGQQVVRVAHVPKLESVRHGGKKRSIKVPNRNRVTDCM